jgi:outer membrane protein assembly factor BamD
MKKFSYCAALVPLLSGCVKEIDLKEFADKKADEIIALAKSNMDSGRYDDAVQIFDEFCKLYPYSKRCGEAELLSGYCKYMAKEYDAAIAYYESFIKTRPTHEKAPYALYMLAMINFNRMPIVERCQESTVRAMSYFTELCDRYPDSKYVKDSKKKIEFLNQHMAGREIYIARYYQSRSNYAAAINRLNTVIDSYQSTVHVPEAFHRLVECYVAMGLVDEARRAYSVLKQRFPNSSWKTHSESLLTKYGSVKRDTSHLRRP